jgi:hypothetical protein
MTTARLQELKEMATKLLATARKLPQGPDRQNALQQIGKFRERIIALQHPVSRPAHPRLRAKVK